MREAYQLASKTVQKEQSRAKKQYDRKTYGAELQPGCRVLVRNFKDRGGPGKLRSYWEEQVHIVVERKHKDSPVYTVRPERGPGKARVLHRNLLLPCDFLPVEEDKLEAKKGASRRKRKAKPKDSSVDSSSDDESKWRCITQGRAEPFDQVRSQLRVEAEEIQPQAAVRDLEQNHEIVEERTVGSEVEKGETMRAGPVLSSEEADEMSAGQVSTSDEADDECPESQPTLTRKYPFRQRNPPKTLTYDRLGQPSVTH